MFQSRQSDLVSDQLVPVTIIAFVASLFNSLMMSMVTTTTTTDSSTSRARCEFLGAGTGSVSGYVDIVQNNDDDFATFSVGMQGLSANQNHGFHVHQFGDLGSDCMNTGGHYDPPSSVVREVGDLGHLTADAAGRVDHEFTDNIALLTGDHKIMNRAMVVHAGHQTNNSKARIGCCIIQPM